MYTDSEQEDLSTDDHEQKNTMHVFLTAKEVAKIFFQGKLKYSQVLQMTRSGELPAKKQGKSYLYLLSALEIWAEKAFAKPTWAQRKSITLRKVQ